MSPCWRESIRRDSIVSIFIQEPGHTRQLRRAKCTALTNLIENLRKYFLAIGNLRGAIFKERLGFRAMLAGTLANFVTATIAGFLL